MNKKQGRVLRSINYWNIAILMTVMAISCTTNRKLITDEVILKDENSITGTIMKCDSSFLKIQKMDESMVMIPWLSIDTVVGKKYKTLWFGINAGYYNTPYFSVFKNEAMTGKAFGMQFKFGKAIRGNKLYYLDWSFSSAHPYAITKFGAGYQRYIKKATYLGKQGFFWGAEYNFMNAKHNNGAQMTLEPFSGFEKKCTDQIRLHFKLGLQFNVANKNNSAGINFTLGAHFMKRNFKKYYDVINSEHRLPKK